jgi:hypothetical protein
MKKLLLLVFCFTLSGCLKGIYHFNDKLFFYIPNQEEIKEYFEFYNELRDYETGKVKFNEDITIKLYADNINKNTLKSLLFESFLRQTKNTTLKNYLINIINKNHYDDLFSQLLIRLYESKVDQVMQNNKPQTRYNYKNQFYDENINLFNQHEILVFNKKLSFIIFNNTWNVITFKESEKNTNKDFTGFIFGGGTNSICINFDKNVNISFSDFKKNEIENEQNSKLFENWTVKEIGKTEILNNSGADIIYIGAGIGPDQIGIESGAFIIYLYDNKNNAGYKITLFMNFSKINNNYELRYRIWNQLLMQLCFAYIKN